jgi:chemotaxis protein MotB
MGKKKKDEPAIMMGAPEWIVTFADMMTLLLCFFIILFALSEIKSDRVEAVRTSVRDWMGKEPASRPVMEPVNVPGAELENFRDTTMGEQQEGGLADQITLEDFKKKIQTLRELPPIIVATGAYLRFVQDSAELTKSARQHLAHVAGMLRGYPGQRVEIVGHVAPGDPAMDARFKDPLELGYHRARVVRDVLVNEHGLDPVQFKVTTVGTYYPPDPAKWLKQDMESNDRVEIIVTKVPLLPVPAQEERVGYNLSGGN